MAATGEYEIRLGGTVSEELVTAVAPGRCLREGEQTLLVLGVVRPGCGRTPRPVRDLDRTVERLADLGVEVREVRHQRAEVTVAGRVGPLLRAALGVTSAVLLPARTVLVLSVEDDEQLLARLWHLVRAGLVLDGVRRLAPSGSVVWGAA